ncbi:HNH endonuclease [Viridibacillus arvi]|uniref:HNH endonuclease n=1 Tax=Viridibacillus arvi TaxID=263475 RepID=UPI003CFFD3CF
MPKKRSPSETWYKNIRPIIWKRDGEKCVNCSTCISLSECHIDHILSGLKGSNKFSNLRTLCPRCHVLRSDNNHRGMIQSALGKNLIVADWRKFVWDEKEY